VGDETIEFASRFSNAVNRLALVAEDGARGLKVQGAKLTATVREALDAVEAVYATGTNAVRNWPERRRLVLAQVAAMREALDRSGVDGEARRIARALIDTIGKC